MTTVSEKLDICAQEPLSDHTSYRIGGPADLYGTARTGEQLRRLIEFARNGTTPYCVIGAGTNILVSDSGFRGLVIENRTHHCEMRKSDVVRAESGKLIGEVARETIDAGLAGLEWAVDIPGTVGGAVVGNAGAFGGYVSDVLLRVQVLSPDGEVSWLPATELGLAYRTSRLKAEKLRRAAQSPYSRGQGEEVVLAAEFALRREDRAGLWRLAGEYARRRRERQPCDPCAGSVFKRTAQYPAGFLIEQAGLKGERRGEAEISPKHANFIVNRGHARATDVRALIDLMRDRVMQLFGLELELEIELIGEW